MKNTKKTRTASHQRKIAQVISYFGHGQSELAESAQQAASSIPPTSTSNFSELKGTKHA
jgi:hypothetical protein